MTPAAGDTGSPVTYLFNVNVLSTIGLTVPGITATTGVPFAGVVATFPDNGTTHSGTTSAEIAWGDGNTTDGTLVAGANGQWNVLGMHSYSTEGANSILVTVRGITSADATATGTATVVPPPTVAVGGGATAVLSSDSTYVTLNVLGAEGDESEGGLTYTWTQTGGPSGASAAVFSDNGTNSAKNQPAYLSQAGTYTFMATIANAAGTTITSSAAAVTVDQIATDITTTPASAIIAANGTQAFSASEVDQFGNPMATQPDFTWTVESGGEGGTIDSTGGSYTAGTTYGADTIDVTDAADTSITGQAGIYDVTAAPAQPTGLTAAAAETAVVLSWDPQQDAATYSVYRGTSAGGENSTAIATGLTDPSYTDTNLTDGIPYYYFVRAVNPIGTSSASREAYATPAPVAVTGLTAAAGDGVVNVSWDPALGALSYNLYEGSTAGGEGTTPYVSGLTQAGYSDSNTSSTMTNYYLAQPVYPSGPGEISGETDGVQGEFAAPSAPTGLTATANGTNEIDLGWTAGSTDTGGPVDQFIIQRSTNGGAFTDYDQVPASETVYQDSNISDGTTYHYQVRGSNIIGDSPQSDPAQASIPLATPAGLTATAVSSTGIHLSWFNNSATATGFEIQRSPDGTNFSTVANLTGTGTTYSDTSLSSGTPYTYRVLAKLDSLPSDPSGTAGDTTFPATPTNFAAAAASPNSVNLSWNAINGATGLQIEREDPESDWTVIATLDGAAVSYSDASLAENTAYTYRISAYNGSGTSDPSDNATASTPQSVPLAPFAVMAEALSDTQIGLVWASNAFNEDHFLIQQQNADGSWTDVGTVDPGTNEYTIEGLAASTQYTFRVAAVNAAGQSAASSAPATTLPAAPATLTNQFQLTAAPVNTPESGGSSKINVTYSGPPGANLELEEMAPGFTNYQVVPGAPSTGTGSTPYSVPHILAGDAYTFRLRADLNGQVIYSNPFPTVTTPSQPAGAGVPAAPTIVSVTPDATHPDASNPGGYLDVVVSDQDPTVSAISAGVNAADPYVNSSIFGFGGDEVYSPGSDGNYHLLVDNIDGPQGPGILSVAAWNGVSGDFSPIVTQAVTIPASSGAVAYTTPTLTWTTTGTHDLLFSWTGALAAGSGTGTAWQDTYIAFGDPDGHSNNEYSPADGDPVVSTIVNPDGSGSEEIDPTQPHANGVGDYVYVDNAFSGDISNLVQISPYDSPPNQPANLTATPYSNSTGSGFHLLWDDTSNNETGFTIQRSTDSNFPTANTQTFTVGGNVTNYDDTSAVPGVTYHYQVQATNSVGASSFAGSGAVTLNLAKVSISALPLTVEEDAPDGNPEDGYFEISRTGGDPSADVQVSLGDTAASGAPYILTDVATGEVVNNTVDIPSDVSDVLIGVARDPSTDSGATDTLTATVAQTSVPDCTILTATAQLGVVGTPQVQSLEVDDMNLVTNSATSAGQNQATLYVQQQAEAPSFSGQPYNAKVLLSSIVSSSGNNLDLSQLRWKVVGAGVVGPSSGDFADAGLDPHDGSYVGPSIELDASSTNRTFTVQCWYDANGNRVQDPGEQCETVIVQVVNLSFSGSSINRDNPLNTTPTTLTTGPGTVPTIYQGDTYDRLASDSLSLTGAVSSNVQLTDDDPLDWEGFYLGFGSTTQTYNTPNTDTLATNSIKDDFWPGVEDFTFTARMPTGVTFSAIQKIQIGVRTPDITVIGYDAKPPTKAAVTTLTPLATPAVLPLTAYFPITGPLKPGSANYLVATDIERILESDVHAQTAISAPLSLGIAGGTVVALTPAQATYLFSWFNIYEGNRQPPTNFLNTAGIFDKSALAAYEAVPSNYRTFNDMQIDYVPNATATGFVSYKIVAASTRVGSIQKPYGSPYPVPGNAGPAETGATPKLLTQGAGPVGISSINDARPDDGTVALYNALYNVLSTTPGYFEDYGSAIEIKPQFRWTLVAAPVATESSLLEYAVYEDGVPSGFFPSAPFANFYVNPYPGILYARNLGRLTGAPGPGSNGTRTPLWTLGVVQ